MNELICGYLVIELFVFVFVFCIGGLIIALSDTIYDLEEALHDKEEFFRCVFQWQYAILNLSEYVKPSGIIFLIAATSIFLLPFNFFVFAILLFCEIIRLFIYAFMVVFGKKDQE